MKISRRNLLRSAPVAVAAIPMAAQELAKQSGFSLVQSDKLFLSGSAGGGGGELYRVGKTCVTNSQEEWLTNEIKGLLTQKRQSEGAQYSVEHDHQSRVLEGARLDGLRSLSPATRLRKMLEWEYQRNQTQYVAFLDRKLQELCDSYPIASALIKTLGV